ncbi:MAG: histidine phosphatase family protein [Actinobacteria bacterium]|nr:histidine phosphatase family protein [Actinomycetota bacterium]
MAVTELVLVRHGESVGNLAAAAAQAQGAEALLLDQRDADVPLSPAGEEQAAAVGTPFEALLGDGQPTRVWASPYRRAVKTAEIALASAGWQTDILLDERLRDRELGVLDLLTWRGVQARFPFEAERRRWLGKFYHRPAGGESWADVALRLRSFLRDALGDPDATRLILFSHDADIVLLRYVCEGMTETQVLELAAAHPVRNASVTRLQRDGTGRWSPLTFNDVGHLQESGAPITQHRGESDVRPR